MAEETKVLQRVSNGIPASYRQFVARLPAKVRVIAALLLRRLLNTEFFSYTSRAYK